MTDNLTRRLKEHSAAKGENMLVHAEQCGDRKQARLREKFWKSGYGRE